MDKIYKWLLVVAGVLALGFCIYAGMEKGKKSVHRLTIVHVNWSALRMWIRSGRPMVRLTYCCCMPGIFARERPISLNWGALWRFPT